MAAIQDQIAELERKAEEHKRAQRRHRKELHACMAELERLRSMCGELGIGLRTTGEEETQGHHGKASAQHTKAA